jgi:hydrogenase-4 membrane subunit HyfE
MTAKAENRMMVWGLTAAGVIAAFTGFGNMPLYGRYYIADIPGLAWSGNFIVNLKVHFLAAGVMFALAAYRLVGNLMRRKGPAAWAPAEKVLGAALILVLLSGLLITVKNLPGVIMPLPLWAGVNLFHMGAAMAFILAGGFALTSRWLKLS